MYKDLGNGYVVISNVNCYFPVAPHKTDVLNYSKPKKDQKWQRIDLPTFRARDIEIWDGEEYSSDYVFSYEEAARQETIKRTGKDPWNLDKMNNPKSVKGVLADPNYIIDALELFRARELDRVFNGVWIWIGGRLIYLTGFHYLYLQYWYMDGRYPDFRETDLEFFYLVEIVRHPESPHLGLFYITRRGSGKSFKSGVVVYGTAIQRKRAHCGIQSKDDPSAGDLFKDKIMKPMTTLPDFLIPINPYLGDFSQVNRMEFAPPAKKNIDIKVYNKMKKDALYTMIDYRSSKEYAYDGCTLACIVSDEVGKTAKQVADVVTRMQVNTYCVMRGSEKKGFQLLTSTIEDPTTDGAGAEKIWKDADNTINKNGVSPNSMLRLFCSANDDFYFDEFGFSDRERAILHHQEKIAGFAGDGDAIISYKRKHPRTIEEAFSVSGNDCIYNADILLTAKERIMSSSKRLTRRGDFEWKVKDKEVVFVDNDSSGRWEVSFLPDDANDVTFGTSQRMTFSPKHGHKRVIGMDPFLNAHLADDSKGSFGAAAVYQKFDFNLPDEYCNTFVAVYKYRAATVQDCMEDVLKAAFFYSCPILIEQNKGGSDSVYYAKLRGFKWGYDSNREDFILERPESTLVRANQAVTEGVYMTEGLKEQYTNATAIHIVEHGHKLVFNTIIDELLKYDPKKTKKYDVAIAVGLALVAAENRIEMKKQDIDLTNLFQTWDNRGSSSTILN